MTPSFHSAQRVRLTAEAAARMPEMARRVADGIVEAQGDGAVLVLWDRGVMRGWLKAGDLEPVREAHGRKAA